MENRIMSKTVFGNVALVMRVEEGSKNNKTVTYPAWDGQNTDDLMFQIDQGEGGHPMYRFFRFKMRKADTLMGNMKDLQSAYAVAQKSAVTSEQTELQKLEARIAEIKAGNKTPAASAAKAPRRVKATAK